MDAASRLISRTFTVLVESLAVVSPTMAGIGYSLGGVAPLHDYDHFEGKTIHILRKI